MRPFTYLALTVLRAYQVVLSPVIMAVGIRCRHAPSCSHYGCEAVRRYGAWLGVWMTLARLARCRPGGSHGYDPVPERADAARQWRTPWRVADWRGPRADLTQP